MKAGVCITMSYLVPRTVTVYKDHYDKLREQKGVNFNFSKWVRGCIAKELDEELDFATETEHDERLRDAPTVTLHDGRELKIIDDLRDQGHALTEDEEFVLQVETWLADGYPVPPKTMKRYEEAKERIQDG